MRELPEVEDDVDELGLEPRQIEFLRAYRASGLFNVTCRRLKLSKNLWHYWKTHNPVFAEAYKQAQEEAIQTLESEMRQRAQAGPKDRGSAILLIFALKAARPDIYRDDRTHVNINLNGLSGSDLDSRISELVRKAGVAGLVDGATQAAGEVGVK